MSVKKEKYFQEDTIDETSLYILEKVRLYSKKQLFNPSNTALLILDMQKYFLDPKSHAFIPSASCIIPRIKTLAEYFKKKDLPVFLTRHLNSNENAGLMKTWWRDIIREDNSMSEIIPELKQLNFPIIKKSQYDAFYQTSLEDFLRDRNVEQLVVTGVMTHLCVESTIRSAFIRGFTVFLPIDTTATYSKEFHLASIINLSHGFAIPILSKSINKTLEEY